MQSYEEPDSILIERLQAGADAAFDELMRRYKRPVVSFVCRMLGDADAADDVAQEVFVRVYRNIGDYRPRTKFSTWLFALARNAAIDHLRWRKRHPTESLDAGVPIPASSTVATEVAAREVGDHIAVAVAKLPEDQKTALILSEYHGMTYGEIAQIMHCSEKSVESRLYRAKQILRERLKFLME
jgi:RNA polymerase sigma-70 factor (ECF subfamily)